MNRLQKTHHLLSLGLALIASLSALPALAYTPLDMLQLHTDPGYILAGDGVTHYYGLFTRGYGGGLYSRGAWLYGGYDTVYNPDQNPTTTDPMSNWGLAKTNYLWWNNQAPNPDNGNLPEDRWAIEQQRYGGDLVTASAAIVSMVGGPTSASATWEDSTALHDRGWTILNWGLTKVVSSDQSVTTTKLGSTSAGGKARVGQFCASDSGTDGRLMTNCTADAFHSAELFVESVARALLVTQAVNATEFQAKMNTYFPRLAQAADFIRPDPTIALGSTGPSQSWVNYKGDLKSTSPNTRNEAIEASFQINKRNPGGRDPQDLVAAICNHRYFIRAALFAEMAVLAQTYAGLTSVTVKTINHPTGTSYATLAGEFKTEAFRRLDSGLLNLVTNYEQTRKVDQTSPGNYTNSNSLTSTPLDRYQAISQEAPDPTWGNWDVSYQFVAQRMLLYFYSTLLSAPMNANYPLMQSNGNTAFTKAFLEGKMKRTGRWLVTKLRFLPDAAAVRYNPRWYNGPGQAPDPTDPVYLDNHPIAFPILRGEMIVDGARRIGGNAVEQGINGPSKTPDYKAAIWAMNGMHKIFNDDHFAGVDPAGIATGDSALDSAYTYNKYAAAADFLQQHYVYFKTNFPEDRVLPDAVAREKCSLRYTYYSANPSAYPPREGTSPIPPANYTTAVHHTIFRVKQ